MRKITAAVDAEGCNVLRNDGRVAGPELPHVHFYVIPRRAGVGLGHPWHPRNAELAALTAFAERVQRA